MCVVCPFDEDLIQDQIHFLNLVSDWWHLLMSLNLMEIRLMKIIIIIVVIITIIIILRTCLLLS